MKILLWFFFCFLILLFSATYMNAQHQIPFSVISSGGEKTAGANFMLNQTIGEAFIDKSMNTFHQQYSGFWYVYKQSIITEIKPEDLLPTEFKLEQNFPNPFNPSTSIKYAVPEKSHVLIKIYNIVGEEVVLLADEEKDRGWYTISFNAPRLASGIYIYRMQAGNFISTRKMMLLK